jgi:hypothetical protein
VEDKTRSEEIKGEVAEEEAAVMVPLLMVRTRLLRLLSTIT